MEFFDSFLETVGLKKKKKKSSKNILQEKSTKKKPEKKFLGLTDRQQDYAACILVVLVACYYAIVKVDWEMTIFPRNLSSVVQVETTFSFVPPKPLHIYVTEKHSNSVQIWLENFGQSLPVGNLTFVSFDSELVATPSQLLSTTVKKDVKSPLLELLHQKKISHVVWFKPEWSKHFHTSSTASKIYHIGFDSVGDLKVDCPDDFFVFKKLFVPLRLLKDVVKFSLQVLPVSEMYRRKTSIPVTQAILVDFDMSYFSKQDPIIFQLRMLGLESKEAKFLRAWQAGICLDQKDEDLKLHQFQIIENSITNVFTKDLLSLPKEIFLARVKNSIPIMCGKPSQQAAIWENLHYVLSKMTSHQLDLIKIQGLPAEAGTTAVPSEKQISSMVSETMKFLTKSGLPQPSLITASDDFGMSKNLTRFVSSTFQLHFGSIGIVHTVTPQAVVEKQLEDEDNLQKETA